MTLTRLDIRGVRNLREVSLRGLGRINILFGDNGSGKTSVLESIHLLGMGRSFRTSHIKPVITHDVESCTVYGETSSAGGLKGTIGVSRDRSGSLDARLQGSRAEGRAALAESLPLQVIHADSFEILTGGPIERRHFMDWGVFHVEHQFLETWQRFQKAIKQRNNLLRRGKISTNELLPWEQEMARAGEAIDAARRSYIESLSPHFLALLEELAPGLKRSELRYRRGWDKDASLLQALESGRDTDIQQGFTHAGPQRADIRVTVEGRSVADSLSRGQLKLVVCALKLAQGRALQATQGTRCVYLVDDLTAELDRNHCQRVAAILEELGAQVFITCIEKQEVMEIWPGQDVRDRTMFHVEHGNISSA